MQSVDDLLRKNLEAFGKRDAEKRRAAISAIWRSEGVFYSGLLFCRAFDIYSLDGLRGRRRR